MSILEVNKIETRFGKQYIHRGITFSIIESSVVAIIGSSGCGKSTLLREIIGLLRPSSGSISLLGTDVWRCNNRKLDELRRRFGVLFQNGALFSALTCGENIATPMVEQMSLPSEVLPELVQLRLGLTGLPPEISLKMPSELSGGMRKRVALARALALEPEILFLDEPTSGLDPISARAFDNLVQTLCKSLGLTIVMVTHDLDSIESIADRLIVLDQGKILADGLVSEVAKVDHPWIRSYFSARTRNLQSF
jgi:phospholipid/cholesterol/gamma-HCH transport system ATP-binding protein